MEALTQRPTAFLRSSWPWRSLAYLICSAPTAVVAVGVLLLGGHVGVPVAGAVGLALFIALGLPVAGLERMKLRLVDNSRAVVNRRPPSGTGPRARWISRLRDPSVWRDYGFAMLAFTGLWMIDFGVIALAGWLPLMLISAPIQPDMHVLLGLPVALVGFLLLPVAAYPVTAWAGARAMITRPVLAPLEAEIIRSRARLVDAYESERRRIERDLHDGAQQRLVTLTMRLGLARLDLPPDSPAASQVEQALREAQAALAELRELVRGVHQQVLTDRGLPAAVRDLAGRSPIPVDVNFALPGRLPDQIEVTSYYVVSEALTNIAKHSGATRCRIDGSLKGDAFMLSVRDDGRGGADPSAGSGLAGLADRLSVIDGTITLTSPNGGPTHLLVEIPCPAFA
ncbi:histidine kinase [Sinosporangium siamense]|uniref:histidine kinase n=1 Tax=Sinosporangium siamense TaxID=1367973 RepID=A0A919RLK2_9ACTN|nr:histidine kinase [Sinosporangium siamense]